MYTALRPDFPPHRLWIHRKGTKSKANRDQKKKVKRHKIVNVEKNFGVVISDDLKLSKRSEETVKKKEKEKKNLLFRLLKTAFVFKSKKLIL